MTESIPYVIHGSSLWDEAWLTEQNLAQALAREHPVLYVDPPLSLLTPVRYGFSRDGAAEAVRLARRRIRRCGDVAVLSPIVLPPRMHPAARALSSPFLSWQVRRAVRQLGFRQPVAVTAQWTPGVVGAADERRLICLVKDWVEAGGDLLGRDPVRIAHDRDSLIEAADVVCATSRNLQSALAERGVKSTLLRHGFHADLADMYDHAALPPEYREANAPRLGYTGRINDRLDFELLHALAERFHAGSLFLIGPVSPRLAEQRVRKLRSRPNVHFLGPRDRASLPAYLAHLDCCLLPYRESEFDRYASPLKLWDYLYAGPPIVGSGCPALQEFPPPLVDFAPTTKGFCDAVERAVGQANGEHANQRRNVALANTWSSRASQLHGLAVAITDCGRTEDTRERMVSRASTP